MNGWPKNMVIIPNNSEQQLIKDIMFLKARMTQILKEHEELCITISMDYLEKLTGYKTCIQFEDNPDKLLGMEIIPTAYNNILFVGIKR